jgi:hypothetical protein
MATARPGSWNLGCASPFDPFFAAPETPRPISSFPGSMAILFLPGESVMSTPKKIFLLGEIFFALRAQSFYLCKFLWTQVIYWLDLIRESARFGLWSVVLAAFLRRVSPIQSYL